MQQAKFSVEESQLEFLNNYSGFGFKNKSSMVRKALDLLKKELEKQKLKKSAHLYAEIYNQDSDLSELTDSALSEWPE